MFKQLKKRLYFLKQWYQQVFLYPQQKIGDAVDYDQYWRERRSEGVTELNDWQLERLAAVIHYIERKRHNVSVADIGCGDGGMLATFKGHPYVTNVIGVDASSHALQLARDIGIEVKQIDVAALENAKSLPEADVQLLFEVLEHIPHSEELLRSVYEKTKRAVFFSFPNSGYFLHRLRLLFGKTSLQWRVHPSEHVRFWTLTDVKWWLRALEYQNYSIGTYKGIPVLNKLWPALFAAGIIVRVEK